MTGGSITPPAVPSSAAASNAPTSNAAASTAVRQLRSIAIAEGISFLVLLGIAMPLKYLADMPMAVKVVGWAHGVLFVVLVLALIRAKLHARWSIGYAAVIFIAALLPFGPFVIERRLRQD